MSAPGSGPDDCKSVPEATLRLTLWAQIRTLVSVLDKVGDCVMDMGMTEIRLY